MQHLQHVSLLDKRFDDFVELTISSKYSNNGVVEPTHLLQHTCPSQPQDSPVTTCKWHHSHQEWGAPTQQLYHFYDHHFNISIIITCAIGIMNSGAKGGP